MAKVDQWHYIPVPAIVCEALFDSVQEQLIENKKHARQRKRGAKYLLQGLLVCKKCGYAYYGKPISLSAGEGKRRSYAYYRCIGSDAYRFGGQRTCSNKQVRTDLLEQSVWQDVSSLLKNPHRIENEYKRRLTSNKKNVRWSSSEQLHTLIKKIKRGIARLLDAYQDSLIDKSEFEPRMRRAKERLAKLKAEVKKREDEEAQQKELSLVIGHMQDFADRVSSNLEKLDWLKRREIIRALVKQVEVDEEVVRIVYRVNPPPFVQAPEKGLLQHCLRRDDTPLFSNIYLNEVDKMLERAKEVTRRGRYTYIEYARFADDIVVLVDGYRRWSWLVEAAYRRLREELVKLDVHINVEKTRLVDLSKGETFGFLGFDYRRSRTFRGKLGVHVTPQMKARTALLRKLRRVFRRYQSQPVDRIIYLINPILRGWVNYFRIGQSGRCFGYVKNWVEKKIRRHLMQARQCRSFGWNRWSRDWLYRTLGLYGDYQVRYEARSESAASP